VKKKGGVKGTQIGSALMQIAIKDAQVVIAGPWGISQALPISNIVVKLRGEEA
jgi:hypothetical protein